MFIRISILLHFYFISLTSKITIVKTQNLPPIIGINGYTPIYNKAVKITPNLFYLDFIAKMHQNHIELREMEKNKTSAAILNGTGLIIPSTWKTYNGTVQTYNSSHYSKRQVIATGILLPTGQFHGSMILYDGTININDEIASKDVWYFMLPSDFFFDDDVPLPLKMVPTIYYTAGVKPVRP